MKKGNKLKFYLKEHKTPFSLFLYKLIKNIRYFSLPAPKIIFLPLLYIHSIVSRLIRGFLVFFYWEPLFSQYLEAKPKYFILSNTMPYVVNNPAIFIGQYCELDGKFTVIVARPSPTIRPRLVIGDHVYINFNVQFYIGKEIIIGDHCMIADGCCFRGYSGHPVDPQRRMRDEQDEDTTDGIILEENVWLGQDVKIMPGVRIGKNSVIATGSIVTKDIPSNVMAGGAPAKVLKQLS